MYALLWIKCCAKDSIHIIDMHEIVSIEYCAKNTSIAIVAWRNLAIFLTRLDFRNAVLGDEDPK